MPTLNAPLTKSEEKYRIGLLIDGLPDGYARDILTDILPEMERAIDCDICYVPFSQRVADSMEHHSNMVELCKQREAIKSEIRELERTRTHLENGLNQLRSMAHQFAKL